MAKIRLDKLILDHFPELTREKAQFLIMSGNVLVNDQKIDKCGTAVDEKAAIRLLTSFPKYVSRGGEKLEGAFHHFKVDITNKTVLDVGISTGGFTDYVLQHGAHFVVGVDVGYGQVDHKIRQDPRLLLIERINARTLTMAPILAAAEKKPDCLPLIQNIELVVMDVSFISVTKILPNLLSLPLLNKEADFIILIKPQFEAERHEIGKGGIVKEKDTQMAIIERVRTILASHFTCLGTCESPITGTKGNQEYFFWLRRG
jgi:23S rRNA (cytidine1920-2'-O)/16S rRNA (cytidine1409-2'-O)-methyltransferase